MTKKTPAQAVETHAMHGNSIMSLQDRLETANGRSHLDGCFHHREPMIKPQENEQAEESNMTKVTAETPAWAVQTDSCHNATIFLHDRRNDC